MNNDNKKINSNFINEKCRTTALTRDIILGNNPSRVYPVYEIPLESLIFNRENGRIMFDIASTGDTSILSESNNDVLNDKIETIIWNNNVEKNITTKKTIKADGQLVPGAVWSEDGTIVDGNRRFTILRKLNREYPEDPKFKYFKAAIIDFDKKSLKSWELASQFGEEQKLDYDNDNMEYDFYNRINSGDNTVEEIASLTKDEVSKVRKMCRKIEFLFELLNYYKQKEQLKIIRDLSLNAPMATLVDYTEGKNSFVQLSPNLQTRIKNIYFLYMIAGNFKLPTQDLRSLTLIFKKDERLLSFVEEIEEKFSNQILDKLAPSGTKKISADEFIKSVYEMRKSNLSEQFVTLLNNRKELLDIGDEAEAPIKFTKKVLSAVEALEEIDVPTRLSRESEKCNKIRKDCKEILSLIMEKIEKIIREI